MLSIIQAAGWPVWPLIIASILSVGIIVLKLFELRVSRVSPASLLPSVMQEYQQKGLHEDLLKRMVNANPLGRILAAGLRNARSTREIMKESIEEAGRAEVHELETWLTTLGTIASISPLLGLLGTVIGMVEIFAALTPASADPAKLASGISVALYNTAMGLIVAIPAMIFYRYFRGKVDELVMEMEQQAVKLVEMVHSQRQ